MSTLAVSAKATWLATPDMSVSSPAVAKTKPTASLAPSTKGNGAAGGRSRGCASMVTSGEDAETRGRRASLARSGLRSVTEKATARSAPMQTLALEALELGSRGLLQLTISVP